MGRRDEEDHGGRVHQAEEIFDGIGRGEDEGDRGSKVGCKDGTEQWVSNKNFDAFLTSVEGSSVKKEVGDYEVSVRPSLTSGALPHPPAPGTPHSKETCSSEIEAKLDLLTSRRRLGSRRFLSAAEGCTMGAFFRKEHWTRRATAPACSGAWLTRGGSSS